MSMIVTNLVIGVNIVLFFWIRIEKVWGKCQKQRYSKPYVLTMVVITYTEWKMSKYVVYSARNEKIRTSKTPYLDTFHAVVHAKRVHLDGPHLLLELELSRKKLYLICFAGYWIHCWYWTKILLNETNVLAQSKTKFFQVIL